LFANLQANIFTDTYYISKLIGYLQKSAAHLAFYQFSERNGIYAYQKYEQYSELAETSIALVKC